MSGRHSGALLGSCSTLPPAFSQPGRFVADMRYSVLKESDGPSSASQQCWLGPSRRVRLQGCNPLTGFALGVLKRSLVYRIAPSLLAIG